MTSESFNASVFLTDRQVAAGRGEHVAITGPAGELTYGRLAERVAALAAGLRGLGVRPEERVVLVMSDRPETVVTILAVMRMGAVAVPVSTMYGGAELGDLIRDSRARLVIATPEFGPVTRAALTGAPEVTRLLLADPADRDWAEIAEGGGQADGAPYETWRDSPALWLYTSGTTGAPKAAMHRHGAIRDVYETYGRQVLGIRPDDRCLSVARLFFAYGIGNSLFFPLAEGATTILDPARPTPAGVLERVGRERPTLFFAGPTFFAALLATDAPDDAFASVRLAVSAGEALPAEIHRRFTARFGVEVIDGLGSTEALHIFISNRPGAVRPGTSGTVVPGYEAKILDDRGAPAGVGEPGHLYVRGDSVATGYWCRTAATRQVFQGEWLRTGDMYVREEDGSYRCLGRSHDMIKAGGIWVSPMEVEARLLQHESVGECAVVAYIDGDGLEKPVACVVPAAGRVVDARELIAFCRDGLAAFKRPREVVVLEELPKTATGKIQRGVARRLAADRLGKD
ncbi:Benzoate-CoA ligase [[Actinomadura] parvosata subsp. kistnae]|uniref:Benzoate--CoA ligase n=1 Tax=[Actinomadura] parvosata subsp. kistnae TaxID=1909395 RepID=A0A1V0A295_9ACTN|nr:benzoate-CoA ligase family protein [Nonomuraea sp. ATCC 55076]AQZ64307.1 benzoate--CoA ligase [Nonomuraea sp. ATCC 55076]SPL89069.1 Benzoate-CoA ligase [Actinomadura parvosata subsp. kistnae]